VSTQGIKQSPVVHATGLLTIEHHKINPTQVSLVATKALSYNSFYTIPFYRQTRILLRNGQTQSGRGKSAWPAEYRKAVIRGLVRTLENRTILIWLQKPAATGKACLIHLHHRQIFKGSAEPGL